MKKTTFRRLLASQFLLMTALGAGCGGNDNMNTPATADSKFRPNPNGFSFPNDVGMSTQPGPAMGVAEMRRLFGDQVCGSMMGGCVLTPPAQQWLDTQNKDLYTGLCEGFAVLSNLLYIGFNGMKPSDFQAGATSTYDIKLEGNGKIQRELAYWFITQTLIDRPPGLTPAELGSQLVTSLGKGASAELPTIALFKKDRSGGHAMNAHAISTTADGYSVKIYDNNSPNVEKTLEISTKANTWTYRGATTASGEVDEYVGDATSKTIHLIPTSLRTVATFPCVFCGDLQPGMMPTGKRQVKLRGINAHTLISVSNMGGEIGHLNGAVVNTIPGASVVDVLPGTRGRPDPEPVYNLPGGTDLTITVDGSALKADTPSTLSLFGPGYTLEVEDINLSPGQKDTIVTKAMGNSITYTTQQMETPYLVLGVQTATDDYSFEVRVSGDTNGQSVTLKLDQATGKLMLQVDGHDTADYDIDLIMHRIGTKGDETFTHVGDQAINIGSGASVYINYGTWTGQGGSVMLEIDDNRNGSIDRMMPLNDTM